MKWIVALLSALLAAGTAHAKFMEVHTGSVGSNVPYDLTLDSGHYIWSFQLLDPLPDGVQLNSLPPPNEWFVFTKTWVDGGLTETVDADAGIGAPDLQWKTLVSTPSEWSIDLSWANDYDQCGPTPGPSGQICSVRHEAWWNAAWLPLSQPADDFTEYVLQYEFTVQALPEPASWLTMITGFGLVGMSLRRQRAIA